MRKRWGRVVVLATITLALGVFAWMGWLSPQANARRRDSQLYSPLSEFPGSQLVERRVVSVSADSCALLWCDHYSLHVTFRVPDGVDVQGLKDFYRSHLPAGWKEADESACEVSPIAPPGATIPAGPWRLEVANDELLLENVDRKRVTVVLQPPLVTYRPAEYACYPVTK